MICQKCHGNNFYFMHGKRYNCDCENFDEIDRPQHYNSGGQQPYPFIKSHQMSFAEGNVVKYLVRYRLKGGAIDLKKARWFLNDLIEDAEKQ